MSYDTHKVGHDGRVSLSGDDHAFLPEREPQNDDSDLQGLGSEEDWDAHDWDSDENAPADGAKLAEIDKPEDIKARQRSEESEEDGEGLANESDIESESEGGPTDSALYSEDDPETDSETDEYLDEYAQEDSAHDSDVSDEYSEDYGEDYGESYDEVIAKPSPWPTAFALLLALSWTGAFAYVYFPQMQVGAAPATWIRWVVQWSVPLILIGVLWLAIMRSSHREAARYGHIAHSLRAESHALETRLAGMNRELSLARDFIASQSSELESLGRSASENISAHAAELHDMVGLNATRLETIAEASSQAVGNMEQLKEDLPMMRSSARELSTEIAEVGGAAAGQITALSKSFDRLGSVGERSEQQLEMLRSQLAEAVAIISDQSAELENATQSRIKALGEQAGAMRSELARHEDEAAEAMRSRIEAWDVMLAETRAGQDEAEQKALAALGSRIDSIRENAHNLERAMRESEADAAEQWDSRIAGLNRAIASANEEIARLDALGEESARARLEAFAEQAAALDTALQDRLHSQREQAAAFAQHSEDILKRFDDLRSDMKAIAAQGHEVESGLAMGLELLATKLREGRLALDTTGDTINELTRAANTLLGAIQSSTRTGKEDLAVSLENANEQMSVLKANASEMGDMVSSARDKGQQLSDSILSAQGGSQQTFEDLEALQTRFIEASEAHEAAMTQLGERLAALHNDSDALVQKTEGELSDALESLRASSQKAIESLEKDTHMRVSVLGSTIGARAAEEIERAVESQANSSLSELEEAAQKAAGLGNEVVSNLRDQLGRVNELTSNLEARVSRARESAEEQVDNDFSRRIALLNEALNSNGIDIAKALSAEVTDAQWTSYLRGDRSIFVRRAVRLLDNTEAREIAEIFDNDPDFREHVSRYIHDFEAMLRTMLSTRDGHALGVTLLSSDVGKLYVVLAQAIERLRD